VCCAWRWWHSVVGVELSEVIEMVVVAAALAFTSVCMGMALLSVNQLPLSRLCVGCVRGLWS